MEQRKLGTQGLTVSAIGLGCMRMSGIYGSADEVEAIATIHEALDLGLNFFDTAEVHGPFKNEELVGRALKDRRDRSVIATKFGFEFGEGRIVGVNSKPDHVKQVCGKRAKTSASRQRRLNSTVADATW